MDVVRPRDQVFALLDAHEAPQKKKKDHAVDGAVGEALGYLLQAVDPPAEPALWLSIEDKVQRRARILAIASAISCGV